MNDKQTLAKPRSKWIRALLVVSLGLNILVVGLVGGAVLRGGPPDHVRPDRIIGALGLRAYFRALAPANQSALRDAIQQNEPQIKANRAVFRAHLEALAAALVTEPFEPDRVAQVLADQSGVVSGNIAAGHELLMARITEMSDEDRNSMAARLLAPPKWPRPGVKPQK